ncbi:4'-phosphopantetheinyl transferase superfamily protein [Phyllobacterium sp. YR531]|uniref:4'-phosphopantetheinyl transferase family protein n=1 Tax=Phyllobacterium sp. YR531 TaxID=1144343 RepID=UPI0012F67734|nr:4'-phosphopantetheinyl transferase superfamily protein [Phyllobacterium sp. YR531]
MQLFKFEADRERFLVAHGLKRIILSNILECSPQEIPLVFGPGNKPYLRDGQCHFNLSHSGNWIVMMISCETEVGIDVEQPNASGEVPFSMVSHPNDDLHSTLKTAEQQFYASWTLKEAMSKWDGRGLDRPFNEIRLEATSGNTYRGYHEGTIWHARHATLGDGAHIAYASANPLQVFHLAVS